METMGTEGDTADREIRFSRRFDAPRELVFRVWTNPDHIAHWWGPEGFTTTTSSMEVRVGGQWRYVMHGPDGTDYDNLVSYREVTPPERLVYAHGSNDDDPEQFQVTVEFHAEGTGTRLEMQMLFASAEARDQVVNEYGAIEGGNQTMKRLEAYLNEVAA